METGGMNTNFPTSYLLIPTAVSFTIHISDLNYLITSFKRFNIEVLCISNNGRYFVPLSTIPREVLLLRIEAGLKWRQSIAEKYKKNAEASIFLFFSQSLILYTENAEIEKKEAKKPRVIVISDSSSPEDDSEDTELYSEDEKKKPVPVTPRLSSRGPSRSISI